MGTHSGTKKGKEGSQAPVLTPLTTEEARKLVKPHVGFEQWVEPMANVYETFTDELGKGAVDLVELRDSVASYQSLADALSQAVTQLELISDTRLLYASKAWAQLLAIYRRAKVAARDNPAIARAIEPFEKWMKHALSKKPVATAPKTAAL